MSYDIGPKIGIEGEAEFRKALRALNTAYKTLESETAAVTAEFEANADQQGKVQAQAKQYAKQLDMLKERQKILAQAVQEATAKYGENNEITLKWQRALNETKEAAAKVQGKMSGLEQASSSLADATDDLSESTLDYTDVLQGNLLSNLIYDGLSEAAEMAKSFAAGMIEEASAAKALAAQYSQTLGTLEGKATESLDGIASSVGISSERMKGAYTRIFAFSKTAGFAAEDALGISERAMMAAADSAAYYDTSIEQATETLQSFLKGNYANDAALGISATETTRNTAANQKYAKSFQELSEAQKVDVLLSMVEAGNKASGAFGQAARESDSWENVTGELTAKWKKLQAQLGQPVLENTIPVIQKLTDKLEEAGDSDAFENLADGIGNTLVWLIDNGDNVVRVTAGIAGGITAFKVATNAAAWMDKLNVAMRATWATMSAHPIGAAVTAIAALGAAFAAVPPEATEVEKSMDAMVAKLSEAADAAQGIKSAMDTSIGALDATSDQAEIYIGKLEKMRAEGVDTEEAMAEYAGTVDMLRALLPDVNIELDKQTGLLKTGTQNIRNQIHAWKESAKAQVYAEKYKQAFSIVADAQAELEKAKKGQQEIFDSAGYQQWASALSNLESQLRSGAITQTQYAASVSQANREFSDLQALTDYNLAIEQGNADLQTAQTALGDVEAAYYGYSTAAQESSTVATEVVDNIPGLVEAYNTLRVSIEDSIQKQIGVFETLDASATMTFDDMLAALESQKTAFNDYADNLQIAMERGVDEGLIQRLSDGSLESMQILASIVSGSDEEIDQLNESLGGVDEGRKKMASVMAFIQQDWDGAMFELITDAGDSGNDIVLGLVEGVQESAPQFAGVMENLAKKGKKSFKRAWDIRSPSHVARAMARQIPAGAVLGIEDGVASFQSAMRKLGPSGMQMPSFRVPMAGMPGASSGSRSVSVSLGGVNIGLTAPSGTDLPALAAMVGDIINEQAIGRALLYG